MSNSVTQKGEYKNGARNMGMDEEREREREHIGTSIARDRIISLLSIAYNRGFFYSWNVADQVKSSCTYTQFSTFSISDFLRSLTNKKPEHLE